MDTRSKNSDARGRALALVAFLLFFPSVISLTLAGFSLLQYAHYHTGDGSDNFYQTRDFTYSINSVINLCNEGLSGTAPNAAAEGTAEESSSLITFGSNANYLDSLSYGMQVYAKNTKNGAVYTNTSYPDQDAFLASCRQNQYDFWLIYDRGTTTAYYRLEGSGEGQPPQQVEYTGYYGESYPFYFNPSTDGDGMVLIAIPDIRTYSNSGLSSTVNYTNWHDSLVLFRAMPLWISLSLIGLGLSLVLHRALRRFGQGVARRIRRIPYEFKYVLGILLAVAAAGSLLDGYAIAYSSILTEGNPWMMAILFWLSVLGLYWDLKYNGFKTFRVNIPSVIFSLVRRYNLQFPFQQKIRRQFLTSLLVAIFLGILAFLSAALALMSSSGFFVLVGMGLAVLAVALVGKLIFDYFKIIRQLGQVIDYVGAISRGELDQTISLDPEDDLYPLFHAVRDMQENVKGAIETRIHSEKMKVDLITNVSHDLKTPLTSIISYTQLLRQQALDPPEANDYVTIIDQKSQRLKSLVQDIFDLSKATSGNLELQLAPLDICQLLEQAVGELEEVVERSGIELIPGHSERPLYVLTDGVKLYRVFENLIVNITKYSLPGSRAYIDIVDSEKTVSVIFKNISSYQMNFAGEQMKERFVRGDLSRTTEGSGLGLAIADTFVDRLGGKLTILVDGDLFKAIVTFPQIPAPKTERELAEQMEVALPEAPEKAPEAPDAPEPGEGGPAPRPADP